MRSLRGRSTRADAHHRIAFASLIALFAWSADDSLRAQGTCEFGTSCSQAEKDKVDGICCPRGTAPRPPPPGPRPPSTTPAPKTCSDGRVLSDTICCWPGQRAINGKCRGIPTCPAGFKSAGEDCSAMECTGGRVRPPKNTTRCCWPGQDWSPVDNRCIGIPSSCPAGTEPSGEDCTPDDNDGDGVKNKQDKCPKESEDKDGFQDDDGCPDPDDDGDGVPDDKEKPECRRQAEDKNGFEDDDGCPDEARRTDDSDGDKVIAQLDKCPDRAEDPDGVQDDDGCPETDADSDGIPDEKDKCRDTAEDMNGLEDGDGCPDQTEKARQDSSLAVWRGEVARREEVRGDNMPFVILGGALMSGGIAMAVGQIFLRESVYDGGFSSTTAITDTIGGADALRATGAVCAIVGGVMHFVGIGFVFANMGPAKPKDVASLKVQLGTGGADLRIHF